MDNGETPWNLDIEYFARYKVGDVLWVREYYHPLSDDIAIYEVAETPLKHHDSIEWYYPLFMPKRYARLFLRVTNVRCERLHEMTLEDLLAEGAEATSNGLAFGGLCFGEFWDRINGKKHPWESNPFVWVYEFERVKFNN